MTSGAAALCVAGVLIGVLIGSTGVGGVLLVPFLVHALGYPVQSAVAVALWSFLWSGLLAIALYWRRGSISARPALWLCGAAVPGAVLGSAALSVVPGRVVEALIAGVLLVGGMQTLRRPREHVRREAPGPALLVGLGLLTGFASALLGAGGAFLLVPLLVALGEPVLLAVGLGQVIQVPISAVATVANLRAGRVDLLSGSMLAAALAGGIALGTPLAHGVSHRTLRRLVSFAMLVAAVLMVARLVRLF
ncbi:MAG TPA: sulfite exporter TauE/SafE family protein [Myxococcaceae bacterium]|nr:sulfite exporter TauE/SafE family protein [Myxococcaceae bacterium]